MRSMAISISGSSVPTLDTSSPAATPDPRAGGNAVRGRPVVGQRVLALIGVALIGFALIGFARGARADAPVLELRYRVAATAAGPGIVDVAALAGHFDWLRANGRHARWPETATTDGPAVAVVVEAMDLEAVAQTAALAALFEFDVALVLPDALADPRAAENDGRAAALVATLARSDHVRVALALSRDGLGVVAADGGDRDPTSAHRTVGADRLESDGQWLHRVVEAVGRHRGRLARAGLPGVETVVWPAGAYLPKLGQALHAAGFVRQYRGEARGLARRVDLPRIVAVSSPALGPLAAAFEPHTPAPVRAVDLRATDDVPAAVGAAAALPLTGAVARADGEAVHVVREAFGAGLYLDVAGTRAAHAAVERLAPEGVIVAVDGFGPDAIVGLHALDSAVAAVRPATAVGIRLPIGVALEWRATLATLIDEGTVDLVFVEAANVGALACERSAQAARAAFEGVLDAATLRTRLVIGLVSSAEGPAAPHAGACLEAFRYAGFDSFSVAGRLVVGAPEAVGRQIRVAPLPDFSAPGAR